MSFAGQDSFTVTGDLVFKTVPRWRRIGRQYIDATEEPVFQFNNITRCDSSGVALLLAWLRDAKEKGRVIRFAQMPQQLVEIAQVYGVLDVIEKEKGQV